MSILPPSETSHARRVDTASFAGGGGGGAWSGVCGGVLACGAGVTPGTGMGVKFGWVRSFVFAGTMPGTLGGCFTWAASASDMSMPSLVNVSAVDRSSCTFDFS